MHFVSLKFRVFSTNTDFFNSHSLSHSLTLEACSRRIRKQHFSNSLDEVAKSQSLRRFNVAIQDRFSNNLDRTMGAKDKYSQKALLPERDGPVDAG